MRTKDISSVRSSCSTMYIDYRIYYLLFYNTKNYIIFKILAFLTYFVNKHLKFSNFIFLYCQRSINS